MELYDRIIDPSLLTRRITVVATGSVMRARCRKVSSLSSLIYLQIIRRGLRKAKEDEALSKERKLQEAMISVKKKYGKNAMLKGMNLEEGPQLFQGTIRLAATRHSSNRCGS